MVRKGGNEEIKKAHSNGIRLDDTALPLAEHRGDDFTSNRESISQFGVKICPECNKLFEDTNRSVLEACMHVKCRMCFIRQVNQCHQCFVETVADGERPKKALRSSLSSTPVTTTSIVSKRAPQNPAQAFAVTVRALVGTPVIPKPKANSSLPAIQAPNPNHSNFNGSASTAGSSRNARRPPPPPSPPMQVLPKGRQTYGKAFAAKNQHTVTPTNTPASSSRQAPYVNGVHTPILYGTSPNFPSPIPRPTKNGAAGKQASSVSTSAMNGHVHHEFSSTDPLAQPRFDAESESILGDLDRDTNNENRVNKKKRNHVHIHEHISIVSGDPLLYQCNVCMKKFKTKAHIKYHEFCQNGEKPFKCEQCGHGFIAKSHYEYHIRTHTGERPYVCPKCGKGFNQRGKVTRHMQSHTGEKPFVCSQCGRGFVNAQAMRSHYLIHTGERPFACEFCEKRFTGMTNLKKHVITHTGERPFQCSHCGKSFGLKWTLDLHLRTHSSERPYACEQCSRAFSNSKDLRRHMVIHSGERPFKCWICGTAFRRKDNLNRHIKNTHHQTREVAKQLANEAAAEYLASTSSAAAASATGPSTSTPSTSGTHFNTKPTTVSKSSSDSNTTTTPSIPALRKTYTIHIPPGSSAAVQSFLAGSKKNKSKTYLCLRKPLRLLEPLLGVTQKVTGNPTIQEAFQRTTFSVVVPPVSPKKIPVSPAEIPVSPTKIPVSPTRTPVSPTKTPVSPTKTPVSPTKTPVSPTKTPVSPTKTPVSPTKTPVSPTKTPVSPTKTPVSPTKTPVSPTKTPVSPTKTPVSPTKTPVSPTKTPVSPTKIPVSTTNTKSAPKLPAATYPADSTTATSVDEKPLPPSATKSTQSLPGLSRTRKAFHNYKPQLEGHNGSFSDDDDADADYEVESEGSDLDSEAEDLHDDIERDPNFIVRSPFRRADTDGDNEDSSTSKPPSLRKALSITRKFLKPKQTAMKTILKSPFPENKNTLSRPTPADKLPISLRSKLPSTSNPNSPQSKFREFVNSKRARIHISQQRVKTKKIVDPLRNKNKQIGMSRTTVIGLGKRGRGRPLGNTKNSSPKIQADPLQPFPVREFTIEDVPEGRRLTRSSWALQMQLSSTTKSTATGVAYPVASVPTNDGEDLSVPNSDCIEVPTWRIKHFPRSNKVPEENLDDITFLKRHAKGEEDEKRRKRWDAQKRREDSYVERLKTRIAQRSQKNKIRRKRIRSRAKVGSEEYTTTFYHDSFHPDPEEAMFIEVHPQVPINIIGCQLAPVMEDVVDFVLPWDPEQFLQDRERESSPTPSKESSAPLPSPTLSKPPISRTEQPVIHCNGNGKRSHL